MVQPISITSLENPRVKSAIKLRQQKSRRQSRLFIAEGVREIARAVHAGLIAREVYLCRQTAKEAANTVVKLFAGKQHDQPDPMWFDLTDPVMRKLTYRQSPEGVAAVFEQKQRTLVDIATATEPVLWLVAEAMTKPGNLGAMARSAEAAGASGMLLADSVVDCYNPNAIRASTGAVFTLPIVAASAEQIERFLADGDVSVIVASPDAKTTYTQIDMTGPIAVVIGGEPEGITQRWRQAAARRGQEVSIPLRRHSVDSLNAAAAATVLLYEAVRQRNKD